MRIYLIGFMGSGKSYLGKLWATQNNLTFYDLDEMIEEIECNFIKEIFDKKGEEYFRKSEAEILRKTIKLENSIIACGGGTACFYDNINWMNENGTTVFLNPSNDILIKNLLPQKDKRPLLQNIHADELQNFIENKLRERLPFYKASKIMLDNDYLNDEGFKEILKNI